jgi:hypothetical protein
MFAQACEKARQFTRPVVVSHRRHDGACLAAIGAFVVLNADGWAVTAWHIVEEIEKLMKAARQYGDTEKQRASIYADKALDKKSRGKVLKALPTAKAETVTNASAWWSWDKVRLKEFAAMAAVDLVFVRLEPFDPAWVTAYPMFKDPARQMAQGRSLCRIGFPFHTIEPVFDSAKNAFQLPPGSLPLPFFPIEGILTRHVDVHLDPAPNPAPTFRFRLLETSSPGLRGQSGGPIFDQNGTVWGIQSQTRHFPLGFSPPVPGGKPDQKEHQFLNVGWGVHAETIVGAMKERGITFAMSSE